MHLLFLSKQVLKNRTEGFKGKSLYFRWGFCIFPNIKQGSIKAGNDNMAYLTTTNSGQPVLILKEGTTRSRGKEAQRNNIMAARVIGEVLKTTLGPRGMDKMLIDSLGDITITNDGAAILKEIDVEHPAAKMMVEIAKTQDDMVGDGTTSAVVLASELLRKAEELLDQNIHPTILVSGYRKASVKAIEAIGKMSVPLDVNDRKTLLKVALTSMSSKAVGSAKDHLAEISIDAVSQISEKRGDKIIADIDNIQLVKKTGKSLIETQLIRGIIVDKEVVHPGMPRKKENAKIALLDMASDLGCAGLVEERKIGDDKMIFVEKCKDPHSVAILIRAGLERMVDEAERVIIDALSVISDVTESNKIVAGGGAIEIEIATGLRNYSTKVGGRQQLAIDAFADAVEVIPRTLAENGGLEAIDMLIELRQVHDKEDG